MRAVLVSFMSEYASAPPSFQKQKDEHNYQKRSDRRKAVGLILSQLETIRSAETQYMENIPENLRNSSRYEAASHAVDSIVNAIELLSDAFDIWTAIPANVKIYQIAPLTSNYTSHYMADDTVREYNFRWKGL